MFRRLENTNLRLHVGTHTVTPSHVVRDSGVLLDNISVRLLVCVLTIFDVLRRSDGFYDPA